MVKKFHVVYSHSNETVGTEYLEAESFEEAFKKAHEIAEKNH